MNFVTAFLCCRAAVNAMTRTGAGGRIVNVATRPALEWRAGAGMVAYAASKAAVAALTVALAEEVVQAGILVNAVAPSTMDTPANRRAMPKADHDAWPKVEEVAATILFLASPENRVTRGGVVPVYGADGADHAPRSSRRRSAAIHRLREGEPGQDAVRLGGRGRADAPLLRAAQCRDRNQHHARSLSRRRPGDAGPDRRAASTISATIRRRQFLRSSARPSGQSQS